MTPQFIRTFEVRAAPARVLAVMMEIERWHEWTASVTSIRQLDPGALRIGTRALIRQPKFPPALWKITAVEPGRGFTWVSTGPGIHVTAHHFVEAAPVGTRVTLSLRYEGWLGKLLARMTRGITERYLDMEAEGLTKRSESGQP
jgi:hypothetical protein